MKQRPDSATPGHARTHSAACVCGEINTRHCPVHGQGQTTAASTDPEKITFDREEVVEIAEILASALHHENIGRDIAGWREVSEAFAIVKGVLDATR